MVEHSIFLFVFSNRVFYFFSKRFNKKRIYTFTNMMCMLDDIIVFSLMKLTRFFPSFSFKFKSSKYLVCTHLCLFFFLFFVVYRYVTDDSTKREDLKKIAYTDHKKDMAIVQSKQDLVDRREREHKQYDKDIRRRAMRKQEAINEQALNDEIKSSAFYFILFFFLLLLSFVLKFLVLSLMVDAL
jgi:hypothetical protein